MILRPPQLPARVAPELHGFVQDAHALLRQLAQLPMLNGTSIEDITTVVGTVRVAHGLGRVPLGFWPTNKAGQVNLWHAQAPDKTYIYLGADAATTVDLWVY